MEAPNLIDHAVQPEIVNHLQQHPVITRPMSIPPISKIAARRYVLGRQGLWPGRRWAGKDGTTQALRYIECVQMDPLNVIARSHDLALWCRVLDYQPEHLSTLMYRDREFFDYGSNLRIYPMSELPYWRVIMRRKGKEARWADFAKQNRALLKAVQAELRGRGPLGNRDVAGQSRVNSYRGRKDSAVGLYYLWLTGELMVHHRTSFERVYDFRANIAPPSVNYAAAVTDAERFFARKVFALRGLCTAKSWASWMSFFIGRKMSRVEAQRRLERMMAAGQIATVALEGAPESYYLLADDAVLLAVVNDGHVPDAWQPLDTTTQEEVVFLAPLETVSAGGRARVLFGFDYIWEVYKPPAKRRWGYYSLPILYGDQLVGRLDPKFDRAAEVLAINGFWLEREQTGTDTDFAQALARGLMRLAKFVHARHVDVSVVKPSVLREQLQIQMKEFSRRR